MKIIKAIAAFGLAMAWLPSHAVIIEITNTEANLDGPSDCAGDFTITSGTDCSIFGPLDGEYDPDVHTLISPIIVKYDLFDDLSGIQDTQLGDFPTITGAEITLDLQNGTFEYDQQAGDPDLRFWIAKLGGGAGDEWILYFDGSQAVCDAFGNTSLLCLQSAVAVTSGSFTLDALSHVSFYDSTSTRVPEPAALTLLGTGLLGFGLLRRRLMRRRAA